MIGLYRPGTSALHRAPAGVKLAVLALFGVLVPLLRPWWWAPIPAVGLVLLAYAAAGFGPGRWWAQVRPLRWILLFSAAFQVVVAGWPTAVGVTATMVALVTAAALVTLTTPMAALIDVVVALCGPLRRFGVDADRVGLALMLGLRVVPLVAELARQVREAQCARGAGTDLRAFAVPLLVRALRQGEALGEALVARGADD